MKKKKIKNLLGQDHGQWWFGKDLLKFGLRIFLQCNTSPILLFLKPKHNGSTGRGEGEKTSDIHVTLVVGICRSHTGVEGYCH